MAQFRTWYRSCPECKGTGSIPARGIRALTADTEPCPRCDGTETIPGRMRVAAGARGDAHNQPADGCLPGLVLVAVAVGIGVARRAVAA